MDKTNEADALGFTPGEILDEELLTVGELTDEEKARLRERAAQRLRGLRVTRALLAKSKRPEVVRSYKSVVAHIVVLELLWGLAETQEEAE